MAQDKVAEPVVATGPFRRGGAAASMAISHAGLGGIAYAANSLFNKKKAGGLPQRVFLVVTPTKGPDDVDDRVARRGREGHPRSGRGQGRRLDPGGDPGPERGRHRGPAAGVTIRKQRGGSYWYYWMLIIGGTVFAIAALATDMFGLGA